MVAGFDRYLQIVQVLPRRGPARRPPARVHAGGRGDVVCPAGDDLRPDRAADARRLRRHRQDDRRRRSRGCRTPRRWRGTAPTSRTCGAACRSRTSRELFRESSFKVFKEIVAGGGTVRALVVAQRRRLLARATWTASSNQAKAHGRAGLLWARRARGRRDHRRRSRRPSARRRCARLLDATGAGNGELAARGGGRAATPRRSCSGSCGCTLAKRDGPARPGEVRVPVGGGLPAARVGRRGEALGRDAPPVHLAARRGLDAAGHRPGRGARQGLRPGAQRQRDRRRQHPYPRPGDAEPDLLAARTSSRRRRRRGSGSSSRRSSTERRRTAASRSASTAWCAILANESSIREVIAFPKTATAVGPDVRRAVAGEPLTSCGNCILLPRTLAAAA